MGLLCMSILRKITIKTKQNYWDVIQKKKKVVLLSNLVLSHFPTIPLCSFSNFQMLLLFVVREKREREERGLRDPQLHQPPSASICWKAAAHAEEEAPGIAHVSHCTDSSAVNVRVHAEK